MLLPVGRLIVVADEANLLLCCLQLDDGIRTMYRCAVVGEEGVEERTRHTALWYAGVQDEGLRRCGKPSDNRMCFLLPE